MTYEEASAMLGTAHIYIGATTLEVMNCPVAKWVTESGGVVLLGTNEPYVAIEAKELKGE